MQPAALVLALALAMAAALPALAAEAAQGEPACNQLLPDDADLRLGKVTGAGPAIFLIDGPGCPGPAAACRSKFSARPGATMLLGRSRADYVCAYDARGDMTGWLPQSRVAARPIDPTPLLAAWAGTWRLYDNSIVLKQTGESLEAGGEAYWPSKSTPPANDGAFGGTAKPSGNRLRFSDDQPGCEVDLALAGPFLVVADNRGCGGHNVSFTGIYARRNGAR